MSINDEAADILERAADGFESGRYYWTKGRYRRVVFGTESYCSLGALAHEADLTIMSGFQLDPARPESFNVAVTAMALRLNPNKHWSTDSQDMVVRWNDNHAAKAEVIDVMKHAAKNLRNRSKP